MEKRTTKPTVTILSYNLAGGCALLCATVANALKDHYDIQLVGPVFGQSLWSGLSETDFEMQAFPGGSFPAFFATMGRMVASIRGDIVIAHQFRLTSFGLGLINRLKSGTPCAVYIDDDDLALTAAGRSKPLQRRIRSPNGDLATRLAYKLRSRTDARFCGSDYYAARFGGVSAPLGRDPAIYSPDVYDRIQIRDQHGIGPEEIVVGFIGNPRPHVGIEDLVGALELVDDGRFTLMVVPSGTVRDSARQLFSGTSARVRILENQPNDRVPGFIAAADIVVVPQRVEPVSLGQLPARLVDAMAMAKPIVTTRVSDIPALLSDGALYVDERDPEGIARALIHIRDHSAEAAVMARKGREIFLEKLSLAAMANRLVPGIEQLLRARGQRQ